MSQVSERHPASVISELLSYDPETGNLYWRRREDALPRWNTRYAGKLAGTRKRGEVQVNITHSGWARFYRAHHLAWVILTGEWPSAVIDRRDGNPHNNRASNLRLASISENSCNRKIQSGACRYRGVYLFKKYGKYAAQIKKHGKWRWLGLHETPESAARAYDEAAVELHGEFAVTNQSLGLLEDRNAPVN